MYSNTKFISFMLVFCLSICFVLPCQKTFASSATSKESPGSDRTILYVIGAAFVAIGGYIFYLAFSDSESPSVEKTVVPVNSYSTQIVASAPPTTTQLIKTSQLHPKFSILEQYLRRFIANSGRSLPSSATSMDVANKFLEVFSIQGLLASLRSFPSSDAILSVLPPDLSSTKIGLKVHMRHYSTWLDNFPLSPVLITDNELDKEFFAALRNIAAADKSSSHWPDDLITVHLFLKSMSYDAELSYVPKTDAGRSLHSFLLSEYDFIRSEKWRTLMNEFKHID